MRTTIDPDVQRAAVEALAGRYGGIAVMRPRDGEVLALAGIAYSAPQPPGSTFKIVTLAGAAGRAHGQAGARFPVQTDPLEGVELQNANGEACGGSLRESFAESCNSVFAPLGAKLGAERLVAAAERFGFNEEPKLTGAARSTLPAAGEIGDDLAVGSTAIGQGKVLTTPLQMAEVAATIGERGMRPQPTLLKGAGSPRGPGHQRRTARFIARAMRSWSPGAPASAPRSPASGWRARPAPPSCARRSARPDARARASRRRRRTPATPTPGSRLRAAAQPARGGVRAARRPGSRRRDGGAGGRRR